MGEKYLLRRAVVSVVWLSALAVPACGGSSAGGGSAGSTGSSGNPGDGSSGGPGSGSSGSPGNGSAGSPGNGSAGSPNSGSAGSTSSGSCGSATGCGGDIVGTWKIESFCSSTSASSSSFCPSATVGTSGLSVTGTLTFGADLTYQTSLVDGGVLHYTIPNSCLTTNGVTLSCTDVGTSADASGTFSAVSCQTSGDNCLCDFTAMPQTVAETGTYSLMGSNLTLTPSTGTPSTDTYCVNGNELHMSEVPTAMDAGMMGTTSSSGQLVAIKQ